jgi:hypothetical protein
MSFDNSRFATSASRVLRCKYCHTPIVKVNSQKAYLILVNRANISRHSLQVVRMRFDLLDLREVHLREVQLLLALPDLDVEVDLALERNDRSATGQRNARGERTLTRT